MANVDDLLTDVIEADKRFEGLEISDQEIEFIKVYEEATNQRFFVTKENMSALHKGVACFQAYGVIANAVQYVQLADNVGTAIKDGDVKRAYKAVQDFAFGTVLSGIAVNQIAILMTAAAVNPFLAFTALFVLSIAISECGKCLSDILADIFGLYDKAGAYTYPVDPLIFDLDGDGIETVSVKDGVNFDFDNNGFAEKIGWVGADDGLLVRDLNGNGNIDNGGELFGDLTAIADGINAVNGFEALKAFDGNGDGIIDSRDSIYAELKIWQDKNLNGMVDEGELSSLREAGIAAIGLDYNIINEKDAQGNMHTQQGYYIKTDGSTAMVEDVWFDRDAADTVIAGQPEDKVFLEETEAVRKLPDIPGSGNQYSLHQAMLRDETGILQGLVEQYVQEENLLVRKAMLPQIIYVWTGAADKNPSSRGENLSDARKLEALEVVTGRKFDSNYGSNPVAGAADYIEQAFDQLVELYFVQMEQQTSCAGLYGIVFQNFDVDDRGNLYFGMEGLSDYLAPICEENPKKAKALLVDFVKNMKTTGMIKMINEKALYETVSILGEEYAHAVKYIGDDTIYGSEGDDVITGETGNDILNGGDGNDTYIFHPGDGRDIINETGGEDCILFGEGIRPEDIKVTRDRRNLYLTNAVTGDRIQVNDYFSSDRSLIEQIRFSDGMVWNMEATKSSAKYYYGTEKNDTISAYNEIQVMFESAPASSSSSSAASSSGGVIEVGSDDYLYGWEGNDTLYGNLGDDHLYGGDGNDKLYGGEGNDWLNGETGNDNLYGGAGDDTYFFNIGDGEDTITEGKGNDRIVFGEGIQEEDIRVSRDSRDLYLTNMESGDRIRVQNFFSNADNIVEEVVFADGTRWGLEEIYDRARYYYGTDVRDIINASDSNRNAPSLEDDYIYGGAGDDLLYGNSGNDKLYGEAGNDILYGGTGDDLLVGGTGNDNLNGEAGDDTYLFNIGDGEDTITEGKGNDRIVFGEGIQEEDIRISRDSRDLYLTNMESGDRIRVQNFFSYGDNIVEEVAFADGTIWGLEEIYDRARYYYGTEGNDNINASDSNRNAPSLEDDYIYGGAGDDLLYGNSGNDKLYGEAGNDILYGGTGDDLLVGGTGNDNLNGGAGDDTYFFNIGDGEDTITEGKGNDRIVFGEGIREEDIRISRDSRDLYLTNMESGDRIRVQNFFSNADYIVEEVVFEDGTIWGLEEIYDRARYYYGTDVRDVISGSDSNPNAPSLEDDYIYGGAGDDILSGNNGNDELYGEAGNDTLNGGNGDDPLVGGSGNDNLNGGSGDDTYLFNIGDGDDTITEGKGNDRIVFGEGIREEDIRVSRDSRDLYLTNMESGDRIRVQNFFSNADYIVEEVVFADGTIWGLEEIYDRARYYYGTDEKDIINAKDSNQSAPSLEDDYMYGGAGDDILSGNNGNDELYGEAGNDTLNGGTGDDLLVGGTGNDSLNGGSGDDTYLFNIGDGEDTITEGKGNDRIMFGEGIQEEDIRISRDSRDLYLTNRKSGDRIRVQNFFSNVDYIVEEVVFADGSRWGLEEIYDRARYYYGTDVRDVISATDSNPNAPSLEDDYIYGGAGDDLLNGNNGNDELYGEAGNDTLNGGTGDDLLVGGTGNDNLNGGSGDDTYLFDIGDGQDRITESGGNDRILFGEGIEKSDLIFAREQNHLKISLAGREDTITVSNHFGNEDYRVESFQTSDGSILDYTKLNVIIQAMASFEDTMGMMWEDAVVQKNEEVNDMINQWWTKEVI